MQAKFDKIRKAILEPMHQFYGGNALNQYQAEAFVEDLGDYPKETLEKAWQSVRRNSKSRPNVAHFIAAIKEEREKIPLGISSPKDRKNEFKCKQDNALAEEMMRSPIGKLGLQHGVGNSVWMAAYRDGKRFDEPDVMHQKRQWLEAIDHLVKFPNKNSQEYTRLVSFHDAIVSRERELAEKYAA